MNDFETTLKRVLNERVDELVGLPRRAPAFDPGARTAHGARSPRTRRWTIILAAAACVTALAGGTALITHHLDKHPVPPVRPVTSSPPAPAPDTVRVGGAAITIPSGWIIVNNAQFPAGSQTGLCLTTFGVRVAPDECVLQLTVLTPRTSPIDVDGIGGFANNGGPCFRQGVRVSEQEGERTFGGRAAEWRHWQITCAQKLGSQVFEQYVVPTGPGFILSSSLVGAQLTKAAAVHTAITEIAKSSRLPAQTEPVRLMDRGYLRGITPVPGGIRITLDRVIARSGFDRPLNGDSTTYDYVIPRKLWNEMVQGGAHFKKGSYVQLWSDGTTVTQLDQD